MSTDSGKHYHKACTGQALETVNQHQAVEDITLFGSCFCPFVQRVWVALEFFEIPYQYYEVDPYKKPLDLLQVSPKGLVPGLKLNNYNPPRALNESTVILEYLEDLASTKTRRSLLPSPSDPYARALIRLQADQTNRHLIPSFYRFLQAQSTSAQIEAGTELHTAISDLISLFERTEREVLGDAGFLGEGEQRAVRRTLGMWVEGGELGWADVMAGPCESPFIVIVGYQKYQNSSELLLAATYMMEQTPIQTPAHRTVPAQARMRKQVKISCTTAQVLWFYDKFPIWTRVVTKKSSTNAQFLIVELAHLKPHKDTRNNDDMNRWAWMMGRLYRGTFHIDCRLNLMPLNVYVHRLLDAHLVTFVLDDDIINSVRKKLIANSSAKTVTEKRQRILTDLDREMPEEGWPVTLVATVRCDRTEAILVHDLKKEGKQFRTAEKHEVYKFPFSIPFRTSTSPVFILANMHEERKTCSADDMQWYEKNWGAERWKQFDIGAALINYIEIANVPDDFKKRAGRNTRSSGRGETVPGSPEHNSYDYKSGEYVPHKTSAGGTQSEPDKEYYSDLEEEGELSDNEPSGVLPVHPSRSNVSPSLLRQQNRPSRGFQMPSFSGKLVQQDSDADDEMEPESSSEAADNGVKSSSSETAPIELSESSSEYVNEETGNERGARDSPLRLRSHQSSR
ncbi:hypothetical protein E4T56_gene20583 [Termitomyces sp. T112]|nr:hypothetical protein E4T56_gene20583 [Termitomyces sp. T112]